MFNNKVSYGICKVHYAIKTEEGYDTPKPLPGAVKITLSPKFDDDMPHYLNKNYPDLEQSIFYGYEGTLTIAKLPADFCVDVFDYETSQKGLAEKMTGKIVRCALLFETDGDIPERHCYYSCIFKRPEFNGDTKADQISISTSSLSVIIRPNEDRIVKLINDDITSLAYRNWFKAVQ